MIREKLGRSLGITVVVFGLICTALAADNFDKKGGASTEPTSSAVSKPVEPAAASSTSSDILQLKTQLADQQRQIEELRRALEEQKKLLDRAFTAGNSSEASPAPASPARARSIGDVASTTPMIPSANAAPALPPPAPAPPKAEDVSPLQFRIGTASITPVGFMDFTAAIRSTDVGSGIGTNFGGIPFGNSSVPAGNLSETRLSMQNSRLGIRVDAAVGGANVLGYMEADFLGAAPGNLAVSSNSNTLRSRLYWVDVRKGKWEMLGGQSWSLMTPNRKGISALPGDLFFSQDIDTNYQAGLTWSRDPGFRVLFHPNSTVTWALGLEHQEQYIGGSAGGGLVTLPSGLSSAYANQLNNGGNTTAVPNAYPAVITKLAFDPRRHGKATHFEVAGFVSTVRVYNPTNAQKLSATGGGGEFNFNIETVKNFRLIANTYWSDGGGRWLFGQAPDTIIDVTGRPSLIRSGGTVDGFEYQVNPKTLIYAYYGGIYIARNVAIDSNGKPVGYGFSGSPATNNRTIQEGTLGWTQTFWKDAKYGALAFMAQYSYLTRNPWFVATGTPGSANTNMVFLNLRYTLPGSAPAVEH